MVAIEFYKMNIYELSFVIGKRYRSLSRFLIWYLMILEKCDYKSLLEKDEKMKFLVCGRWMDFICSEKHDPIEKPITTGGLCPIVWKKDIADRIWYIDSYDNIV